MPRLTPAAEVCARRLGTILSGLRELCASAKEAHDLMETHDLAPEAPGCVPDQLDDLIGHVEETLRQIGARVPAERRAA